jgi:hypothetical protein
MIRHESTLKYAARVVSSQRRSSVGRKKLNKSQASQLLTSKCVLFSENFDSLAISTGEEMKVKN